MAVSGRHSGAMPNIELVRDRAPENRAILGLRLSAHPGKTKGVSRRYSASSQDENVVGFGLGHRNFPLRARVIGKGEFSLFRKGLLEGLRSKLEARSSLAASPVY